jgi:hypothetical protein
MTSPLAESLRNEMLEGYASRGTRLFVADAFVEDRKLPETEVVAALEELAAEGVLELRGNVICPEGHTFWVSELSEARDHVQSGCHYCEPSDDEECENRLSIRASLNQPAQATTSAFEEKVAAIRERMRRKFAEPPVDTGLVQPNPPPRYDEVFFKGIEWLDTMDALPSPEEGVSGEGGQPEDEEPFDGETLRLLLDGRYDDAGTSFERAFQIRWGEFEHEGDMLFLAHGKTEEDFERDCRELSPRAAQMVASEPPDSWIGAAQIVACLAKILPERGYRIVEPVKVHYPGSTIIKRRGGQRELTEDQRAADEERRSNVAAWIGEEGYDAIEQVNQRIERLMHLRVPCFIGETEGEVTRVGLLDAEGVRYDIPLPYWAVTEKGANVDDAQPTETPGLISIRLPAVDEYDDPVTLVVFADEEGGPRATWT